MDRKKNQPLTNEDGLTDDGFQQKLYAWFMERGLLNDMRAQLRHRMIGALRENDMPLEAVAKPSAVSPKLQAANLLVADFLLHQQYNYTLSVFATEVPLLNSMPEFSMHLSRMASLHHADTSPPPRFHDNDVLDILQALGYATSSRLCSAIVDIYRRDNVPLMMCIVQATSRQDSASKLINTEFEPHKSPTTVGRDADGSEMKEALTQDLKLQRIKQLQLSMRRIHEAELLQARNEAAAMYSAQLAEEQLKWERLEVEYREKQERLTDVASQLREQHQELSQQLHQIGAARVDLEEEREKQKLEVEERNSDLDLKQKQLNEALFRLAAEQSELARRREALEGKEKVLEVEEKKVRALKEEDKSREAIQEQCAALWKKLLETCERMQQVTTQDKDNQEVKKENGDTVISQEQLEKALDEVRRLEEENADLREHSLQQRRRIDELMNRAVDLTQQLEEAHAMPRAPSPAPILQFSAGGATSPPLADRCLRHVHWRLNNSAGGGEENAFGGHASVAPTQQTSPPPRRHPPRRHIVHTTGSSGSSVPQPSMTSSTDDSSPTDEILHDARSRLRRLEEESEEVDRRYREFQAQHASLSHAASILYHPEHSIDAGIFSLEGHHSSTRSRDRHLSVTQPTMTFYQPFSGFHGDRYNANFYASNGTVYTPSFLQNQRRLFENLEEDEPVSPLRRHMIPKFGHRTPLTSHGSHWPPASASILKTLKNGFRRHGTRTSNGMLPNKRRVEADSIPITSLQQNIRHDRADENDGARSAIATEQQGSVHLPEISERMSDSETEGQSSVAILVEKRSLNTTASEEPPDSMICTQNRKHVISKSLYTQSPGVSYLETVEDSRGIVRRNDERAVSAPEGQRKHVEFCESPPQEADYVPETNCFGTHLHSDPLSDVSNVPSVEKVRKEATYTKFCDHLSEAHKKENAGDAGHREPPTTENRGVRSETVDFLSPDNADSRDNPNSQLDNAQPSDENSDDGVISTGAQDDNSVKSSDFWRT